MKKFLILIVTVIFLFPIGVLAEEQDTTQEKNQETTEKKETTEETKELESEIVSLENCVDGDTASFKDSSGNVFKTRFLAIDTPETVNPKSKVEKYGKEASSYTCDILSNTKEIKLEYDPNSGKEDNYGRRLAWVWVDGVLLQQSLVEQGLAEVAYLYDDYQYTSLLKEKEEQAKLEKLGIWSVGTEDNTTKPKQEDTKEKKKKGFFLDFFDKLIGNTLEYIDNLLENLIKYIESVL